MMSAIIHNSLWPCNAIGWNRSVNIASVNGLLPDSTKAITGTNFDLSLKLVCGIHLRAISQVLKI